MKGSTSSGTVRRTLAAVLLVLIAGLLAVAGPAVADDEPPIVSVGPIDVANNGVSATVQPDPEVDVCLGGQHSEVDANDQTQIKLNDATCRAAGSGTQGANGAGAGPSGSAGAAGGSGATGAGTASGGTGASGAAGASGKTGSATVNAASAVGLRITGIRKVTRGVQTRRHFSLLVSLRDLRGNRVQGAIVAVSGVPGTSTPDCGVHANFSNKSGVARVVVPVTKPMFGKRLYLKIAARTPKARAVALRSVLLPRLR